VSEERALLLDDVAMGWDGQPKFMTVPDFIHLNNGINLYNLLHASQFSLTDWQENPTRFVRA